MRGGQVVEDFGGRTGREIIRDLDWSMTDAKETSPRKRPMDHAGISNTPKRKLSTFLHSVMTNNDDN